MAGRQERPDRARARGPQSHIRERSRGDSPRGSAGPGGAREATSGDPAAGREAAGAEARPQCGWYAGTGRCLLAEGHPGAHRFEPGEEAP